MFKVEINFNAKGQGVIAESLQSKLDDLSELQDLIEHYGIEDDFIETIEIVQIETWRKMKR